MRILHLLTGTAIGINETYAAAVIKSMHEEGVSQNVVLPQNSALNVTFMRAGLRPEENILNASFYFLKRRRLHSHIRRLKPTIIQCWSTRAITLAVGADISMVGWNSSAGSAQVYTRCAFTVCPSQNISQRLSKNVHSVQIVPFSVPAASLPPIDRGLLSTPRTAKVFLSLGRLHPDQNLGLVLEALKEMPETYAWFEGEGPGRRALEREVEKLGLSERVRFLGARADHTALLRASDLLLLPARRELYGLSILESWAAGTPVIAAARGAPSNLIEDGKNGLLFSDNDREAFLNSIRRLLAESELRSRLIAQGYATYARDHAQSVVTRRWLELYKKAAA